MNIYIHIEVSSRELDSKILLGVLSAAKGHQVLVSSVDELEIGFKSGLLRPGIFHTKSLTPSKSKINRHQSLVKKGNLITSIDEESGITMEGYDGWINTRYSKKTIKQASAVFSWGTQDTDALKKNYPEYSQKIFKVGSPRVDLWRSEFLNYWAKPKSIPQKPYLLISSNLNCTSNRSFIELIKIHKRLGYFERDKNLQENLIKEMSEDYAKWSYYIDAIKYMALNNDSFDIVVRPHPNENKEYWELALEGIPNVHVIREGTITPWIINSFAIMHNGCTSAFEAQVIGIPVLTYIPFKQKYAHESANKLGVKAEDNKELLKKAKLFYEDYIFASQTNKKHLNNIIEHKIYYDKDQLAAEKMIKVWESLDNKNLSKSVNWIKLSCFFKLIKFAKIIFNWIKKVILFRSNINISTNNNKFPTLDKKDIYDRVKRLKNVLGIDKKIECKLLSNKTILIKSD